MGSDPQSHLEAQNHMHVGDKLVRPIDYLSLCDELNRLHNSLVAIGNTLDGMLIVARNNVETAQSTLRLVEQMQKYVAEKIAAKPAEAALSASRSH